MPEAFICAVVLTFNEERHVAACIATLRWADAVLVFDSLSTDATVALAQAAGAVVTQQRFDNYPQQRNSALTWVQAHLAPPDTARAWVFFVDADERSTPALAQELRAVAGTDAHAVWQVPRDNYLFGKLTRWSGWFPDYQARLFRLGKARFDPAREVHEVAEFDGEPGKLAHPLTHFNYDSVAQFHQKQRRYAEYDASILFKQGVRPKPRNFVLQPAREFKRRFLDLRGYRDGLHGLRLGVLTAYYVYDMYRRLERMWRTDGAPGGSAGG